MDQQRSRGGFGGILYITLTLIGWASIPLFLKYFVPYIDGWTANGWRYGISALFWSPVLVIAARRGTLPPGIWRAALVPSAFNVSGQVFYALAPYYINPGLMAFLLRFQMVFLTAGTYILFPNERGVLRAPTYWIGLAVVVFGSIGTIFAGHEPPHGGTLVGIVLAIVSGALFGGYSLGIGKYMANVNPIVSFAAISQLTAAALVTLMLIFGKNYGAGAWAMTGPQLGLLVASAFIGIALAHVFYYAAIQRLGVAISGAVVLLMPFITAVASRILFAERLSAGQWLCGSAAMLGAAAIISTQNRLRPVDTRSEAPTRTVAPPAEPALATAGRTS